MGTAVRALASRRVPLLLEELVGSHDRWEVLARLVVCHEVASLAWQVVEPRPGRHLTLESDRLEVAKHLVLLLIQGLGVADMPSMEHLVIA